MKIAVVGATGLVGQKMLQVLEEQKVVMDELIPVASARSVGKEITFCGKRLKIVGMDEAIAAKPQIAIFSAGASVSLEYAPKFAQQGTYVIDNSSAWRMYEEVPLVVPEINAHTLSRDTHIIANPNCSTIEMVMVLAPLQRKYGIKRLVISTYQSVTGSGMKGLNQLLAEEAGQQAEKPAYPHQIYRNVLPHGGNFNADGYTTEEQKLVDETHKILNASMAITATVVRVPVTGGHSESVNVEFERPYELQELRQTLEQSEGITVCDNPAENLYPMALTAYDNDQVFVGRLRRDFSIENGLNMWIVSDNIRKGAATNAVQIAQHVIKQFCKQ